MTNRKEDEPLTAENVSPELQERIKAKLTANESFQYPSALRPVSFDTTDDDDKALVVVAYPEGDLDELGIHEQPTVSTADVFAVVAAYSHAVSNPTAPEFATYDEAREAGIALLTVNESVVSFRIDKRTTRKA